MPRETKKAKVERAVEVCRRLDEKYGPVECFLDHANPFRLTIAVLLSAQTTDAQVNKVTPALFERFPTPGRRVSSSIVCGTSPSNSETIICAHSTQWRALDL